MTKVLVVEGGNTPAIADLLDRCGVESLVVTPEMGQALQRTGMDMSRVQVAVIGGGPARRYVTPGGDRYPKTWEGSPVPSGEPRIVMRDPTHAERARIEAAKAKRERRQERNNINEARQGRPPDELEWRDGEWWAQCRSCGNDYPIEVESNRFNWDMNNCARNQWCIP